MTCLSFDTTAPEYIVGPFHIPNRFFALLSFCVMAITNGFAWFEFDPIVAPTRARFEGHVTSTTIQLLSSWQPIMFLILFVPITIIITKQDGLRKAMRIGSTCALFGGAFKLLGIFAFEGSFVGVLCLHAGQILVAVGAPSVIGGVSALSGSFFPPHERARATAAAILCNDLGGAVGYLLSPSLASASPSMGIGVVIFFELSLVTLLCLLMWFVFPDAPRRRAVLEAVPEDAGGVELFHTEVGVEVSGGGGSGPSSPSSVISSLQGSDFVSHITFKAQILQVVSKPTPIMTMIIFSWCSGGFVAWTSMFELMLEEAYASTLIGTMSFVTSLGYVLGGLVAGYLIDKYFRHSMATFISCALAIACVSTTAFTAFVPSFPETDPIIGTNSAPLVFVFGFFSGVGYGAATPVFFELLADYAYPVDEAISGGLLSMMEAVGALVIYQVVARFLEGGSMNYAFAAGCALCLVLSTFLDEQHNRPEEEEEGEGEEEGGDGEVNACGRALVDGHASPPTRHLPAIGGGGRRGGMNGGGDAEELTEVVSGGGVEGAPSATTTAEEELRKKKALLVAKKKKQLILAKRKALAEAGSNDKPREEGADEGGEADDGNDVGPSGPAHSYAYSNSGRKTDEAKVPLAKRVDYEDE